MFTTRNLRVFVVFSCAMTLGVLPALAQEPPPPPQEEVAPAPVPEPEPVVERPAQALSVANPSHNTEVSFFLGGLVGGDLTSVISGDFSLAGTFQNGRTYGGRVGYYTFPFGVEGSFTHSNSGLAATVDLSEINIEFAARVVYMEANAILFLIPGPVQPFVTGGGGLHSYKLTDLGGLDINKWGWNFGGGLKINISRVSLRADVRDHMTSVDGQALGIDEEVAELVGLRAQRLHNVEFSFGVGFSF